MPESVGSRYPFSSGGGTPWDPEEPWYDALVAMAAAAAVTDRVEVGVAVLVVPMRNPVVLAKQLASIDALSGGRVILGAGAGWLEEEFEALQVPFAGRGKRLDEWIELMRDCWTGAPGAHTSDRYRLPGGMHCHPTPVGSMPVLVGGMSPAALRRVGRIGDGWLAQQDAGSLDLEELERGRATIEAAAVAAGRPAPPQLVLRVPGRLQPDRLPELAAAGVTAVILDVDWADPDGARRVAESFKG
jgi:probable F420-dependent oxidoreductase